MMPIYFVRTEDECRAMETAAGAIFRLGEQLPRQVFREDMGSFRFLNVVKFAQEEFWTVLTELAKFFGDQEIRMLTDDPTAFDYKEWMDVFGALRFPSATSSQEYVSTLRFDSCEGKKLPALYFSVSTIRWFGSSGRWGIYGSRDFDLAIGAIRISDKKRDEWINLSGPLWLSKQQAQDAVRSNTGHKEEYKSVAEALFRTYGIDF